MADQPKEVYGFHEDPPEPAEAQPWPAPRPRRSPPKGPPAERPAVVIEPAAKARRRREIVAVVVIVVICASVAVFMAIRQNMQTSAEKSAFEAAAEDYLFSPVEPGPGVSRARVGKVALVDMDKRAFDR